MKTFTVQEAQGRLSELIADVFRGDAIVLKDGDREVTLQAGRPLDLEEDSPALETELLKAANGPFKPYSKEEMRTACEQAVQERRAQ